MKSLLKAVVACAAMCGMLSAEAVLPKVVVTDTVRDADGHPTAITVAFQGFDAGESYPLYLFCGADDAGNDTNAWAYVERLDDIAPGETARTIQPPECYCREYYTIRFAANCPIVGTPDTGSYVQDDLEVMWDAIENAAPGVHDATTNVWADLTGHGFDWNINLNNASWTDDGLTLKGSGNVGSMLNGKRRPISMRNARRSNLSMRTPRNAMALSLISDLTESTISIPTGRGVSGTSISRGRPSLWTRPASILSSTRMRVKRPPRRTASPTAG